MVLLSNRIGFSSIQKLKVLLYIFLMLHEYTRILHRCWIVINLSSAVFLDQQLHHPPTHLSIHSLFPFILPLSSDLYMLQMIYIVNGYMLSVFVEVKRNMILYKQAYIHFLTLNSRITPTWRFVIAFFFVFVFYFYFMLYAGCRVHLFVKSLCLWNGLAYHVPD